ncbi:MAG TPA: succinate dehydrogenase assembly factor 2 [Usitatibacteraceae bacterium]|nr:succinate dehydrogenase assembly factor 2 [Usitatibacteraceae bacterium]
MNPAPQPEAPVPVDDRSRERLRWRARRGLLENDILLGRFLEAELDRLPAADLVLLDRLLRWSDNDLLDVLMGRKTSPDAELNTLITRIRAA